MPWAKGTSGNPNGRPRKLKTLTEILAQELAKTIQNGEEHRVAVKRFMAIRVAEAITKGTITLTDNKQHELTPNEWVDLVKWAYNRVDGMPKQATELSGPDAGPIQIQVVYDENLDSPSPAPAS